MHLTSLLPSAALALTANAFLVPPGVSDASLKIGDHNTASALSVSKQSLKLDCEDCQAAVGKDGIAGFKRVKEEAGLKMGLELNFAVRDGHELTLNGARVYPPNGPRSPPVLYTAKQVVEGGNQDEFYSRPMPLSLSIEMKPTRKVLASDGALVIHPLSIEPIGLGPHPVHVSTANVRLAELPNGQLMLLPIQTTPYEHRPLADACTNVFCRVRETIRTKILALKAAALARLGALRGCHRKYVGPAFKSLGSASNAPPAIQKLREQMRHKGHHGHRHHGGFRVSAGRAMHNILLPILLGIITGAFAGAIGMILFAVVRALVRRTKGQHEYVVVVDEQEEGRVSADLPKYEDVPYVEGEEDVDEKKELLPEQRK